MKLCRYGKNGYEKPGMIDSQGQLRDLSEVIPNIDQEMLAPRNLAKLRRIRPESLPLVRTDPRYGVPYTGITKFIGIGLNYADHAAEADQDIPPEPVVFMKATTCISGPNDDIVQPVGATKLDWEVELGVVIGTRARNVSEEAALDYVAGYTIVNDVSERGWQFVTSQWDKGKGADTFGPIGPWLVTADEVPDPQALEMWLDLNGERMQSGSTHGMIFTVAQIISHLSQYMTLMPGDIITTGTPAGSGMGQRPPFYLKPGDVLMLGIDGLGEQRQQIAAASR
ncbi:MAG TPA: fumarylacetoacetate hydrolase family protein [Burkholderiales bacterium]|nr:fumarylacetoacetate hydrolase family protein [Burkholderiales bacterium]